MQAAVSHAETIAAVRPAAEQILWICEAADVPVVWATQVLERLVKDGAASRGEATFDPFMTATVTPPTTG